MMTRMTNPSAITISKALLLERPAFDISDVESQCATATPDDSDTDDSCLSVGDEVASRFATVTPSTQVAEGQASKSRRKHSDEPLKKRPLFPHMSSPFLSDFEPATITANENFEENSFGTYLRGLIQPAETVVPCTLLNPSPMTANPLRFAVPMKVSASPQVSNGKKVKCNATPGFDDEPLRKRPIFPEVAQEVWNEFEPARIESNADNNALDFSKFLRHLLQDDTHRDESVVWMRFNC